MEPIVSPRTIKTAAVVVGTKDGIGAGDHDTPYRFGYRPSARWTYPFRFSEFAHLLILRGRLQNGEFADDRSS
jgi:hypothetical protein